MNLQVKLPNGGAIKAPIEEWVAAILLALTDDQRGRILGAMQSRLIAYETPGSYILHAEPGHLGLAGRR